MVTTNFLNTSKKIYNSKISIVYNIEDLQIGKTYLIINVSGRSDKPFATTDEYKLAQIISINPNLDFSKISNNVTFDTLDSSGYGKYFVNYTFAEYLSSSEFFVSTDSGFEKGWLYYDVEYTNLITKNIEHAIVHKPRLSNIIYIENNNGVSSNILDSSHSYFYMSDLFEYDLLKNKKVKANSKLINNTKNLVQTRLADYLIKNFKAFTAYTILNNSNVIPTDSETITIDGVTWYNGFYNSYNGIPGRNFMFYNYIPKGWRLPTLDELQTMLKKHPLLKKILPDDADKYMYARRNNAELECRYYSYFEGNGFSGAYNLAVMTADSNMYDDESMYFPGTIKAMDIRYNRIVEMSPCEHRWNNGCRPYLLMIVKMTEDELNRQMSWAMQVLDDMFLYDTIDEIYKDFGISDINDIKALTYELNMNKVKEKVSVNTDSISDIRDFLTKITPLINLALCHNNVCNSNKLLSIYDPAIDVIMNTYNGASVPLDMYLYIKNALDMLKINHMSLKQPNSDTSYKYAIHLPCTAYISELTLHTLNKDIIIKHMPIRYINQSKLYLREIVNTDGYSNDLLQLKKNIIEYFKKHK